MDKQKTDALIDQLTGLCKQPLFFQKATEILEQNPNKDFCLMAIDIEHFKLFNDWYGYEMGNRLLKAISEQLNMLSCDTCISGYMGGDDFVILMGDHECAINKLEKAITQYTQRQNGDSGFLPAFGIYKILDKTIAVSAMYDCAMIALQSVKGNYAKRESYFDPKMKQRMEDEQLLLREIRTALQNEELIFYGQPIYNVNNNKIVTVEALIRWQHPEKGLIAPGVFIPVLEQNGFITKVDLYLWEKVCQALHAWILAGKTPIPISVNVSRMDLEVLDLPQTFKELVERYDIPPKYLEIEITESAYMQDYHTISEVIDQLRAYGFPVFMDDFGSGYSSLNMLKDVQVDTIKIDTKFLEMNEESVAQGEGILEAIINIANLMGMKLIAEGVESKEQVTFLHNLGCDYVQGYYFNRPMPQAQLEALLQDETMLDRHGICTRSLKRLSVAELCNRNVVSETMLNNMLGGVAFYDLYENKIELAKANEQYFEVVKRNPIDLDEDKLHVLDRILKEDHTKFLATFKQARKNRNKGSSVTVRFYDEQHIVNWLTMRIFFLKEQDEHQLFYTSIQNITEQKRQEEELLESKLSLHSVLNLSGYNASFLNMGQENRETAISIFSQMIPCGMVGGYCEDGFPIYFANEEMVHLLGYENYEDMLQGIDGKIINTIYIEDQEAVSRQMGSNFYVGLEYTVQYRTVRKDGSLFWTLDRGKVVKAEDGRLAILSTCIDISDSMQTQEQLQNLNLQLQQQNLELQYLTNDQPGGYHRCRDNADFDFIYLSNRFLEMLGYTKEDIQEKFDNKFGKMIHPDDAERIVKQIAGSKVDDVYNLEYRLLSKHGYVWVADQTKKMESMGEVFYYGVILDITNTVELKEKIEALGKQEHVIVNNLLENSAYSFKANLTKNEMCQDDCTKRWLHENKMEKVQTFTDVISLVVEKVVMPEYKRKVIAFLNRDLLLANEQEQVLSKACEYQRMYEGKPCWMQVIYHLMKLDDSNDIYVYLYTVNIDEQKCKELDLKKRAEIDELTGLYNRQTAITKIEDALAQQGNRQAALIMIDLDNFKAVNDYLGHLQGDTLLSQIATNIKTCFDDEDIVCRMGGDEFLVFCQKTPSKITELLTLLLSSCSFTFQHQGESYVCSISAGYVLIPAYGKEFQKLYSSADEALLEAKRLGKHRVFQFQNQE